MTTELAILILQSAIKYGPSLALQIQQICTKKDPTLEEVLAVLGTMKSYDERIAEANLRAGKPADAPVTFAGETPANG